MEGVLVVDKPKGVTSHDVVALARRRLKTREVGHAGTLDPMATGVLVLAIGEATKLVPYLTSLEKVYEAEVTFGRGTDSLDAEGTTVSEGEVPRDLAARLVPAVARELARTEQVPPAFSAIHKDGVRAHELARRGETVDLAPRAVKIIDLRLEAPQPMETRAKLFVRVTKGYYIRSLARDLGEAVGVPAHLSMLRRTAAGTFTLEEACSLDDPAVASRLLSTVEAATRVLPRLNLTERGTVDARAGRRVRPEDFVLPAQVPGPVLGFAAWVADDKLVAIGEMAEDGGGRVVRGFRG